MIVGPNSKFPFGLGLVPKIPRVVVKKKTRRLGCMSCGPRFGLRGLGDDQTDLENAFSYEQALEQATSGMPAGGASSSWTSPTGVIPVLNNPSISPISATQAIPTTAASAIGTGPIPIYNISPSGQLQAPSAMSGLSSYLPWIVLGIGGIALLGVIGKRR